MLQRQADLPPQLHCRRSVDRLSPQPLLDGLGCERATGGWDLPHRRRLTGNLGVKRQRVRCASPSFPSGHFLFLLFLTYPHPAVLGSVTRTGVAWATVRAGAFLRKGTKGASGAGQSQAACRGSPGGGRKRALTCHDSVMSSSRVSP